MRGGLVVVVGSLLFCDVSRMVEEMYRLSLSASVSRS